MVLALVIVCTLWHHVAGKAPGLKLRHAALRSSGAKGPPLLRNLKQTGLWANLPLAMLQLTPAARMSDVFALLLFFFEVPVWYYKVGWATLNIPDLPEVLLKQIRNTIFVW